MSMAYIRAAYLVPAKRGRFVRVWGTNQWGGPALVISGRITSASGRYLCIGGRRNGRYHPTDSITYYADDEVTIIHDTRGAK